MMIKETIKKVQEREKFFHVDEVDALVRKLLPFLGARIDELVYLFSPPTSYRSGKLANLSVIGKKM